MAAVKGTQGNGSVISVRQTTCIILALGGNCLSGVFYHMQVWIMVSDFVCFFRMREGLVEGLIW